MIVPKNRSKASGTPWGSAFGRLCPFMVGLSNIRNTPFWMVSAIPPYSAEPRKKSARYVCVYVCDFRWKWPSRKKISQRVDMGSAMYVATGRQDPKNIVAVQLSKVSKYFHANFFLDILGEGMLLDVSGCGRQRRMGVSTGAGTP